MLTGTRAYFHGDPVEAAEEMRSARVSFVPKVLQGFLPFRLTPNIYH
jgi:hypothetical protein